MRRAQPEQIVHQAIHAYLTLALPPDAVAFAVDPAGKVSVSVAAKLKARGGVRGIPDHHILHGGTTHYLEIKAATGSLSDDQIAFADRAQKAGAKWACVCSVEQAEAALREWGIPLRATAMTAVQRDDKIKARRPGVVGARKFKPSLRQIKRMEALRARIPF